MLRIFILATVGILAAQCTAVSIKRFDSSEPFYDHDPNTPADCTLWWNSDDGLSCDTTLLIAGVSVGELTAMNPSIKSCGDWKEDYSYCIESVSGVPTTTSGPGTTPPTTTTTIPPTTTTSLPGNGITTPIPFQPGMTSSCNRFYFVGTNDQCGTIAIAAGISLADFYAWNPAVGSQCGSLWAANYVCTGIIGSTPTQPVDNGVSTPSPIQPGMVDHCNKFYKVKSGEQCGSIVSSAKISLEELYEWNPLIGRSCTSLWADTYVCVGLLGCKISGVSGPTCGRIGFPVAATGSGEILKHTSGPFVESVENCSGNCLGTPGCTGFHFRAGSYCSLRYGPVSFTPNGNAGSSAYFEAACATCPPTVLVANALSIKSPIPGGKHCGRVGVPIFKSGMGSLSRLDPNGPYTSSVGACAAKCFSTPSCTGFYYAQSSHCQMFWGPTSFSPNGNPGSNLFYEAECFAGRSKTTCSAVAPQPAGKHCGRVGVPVSSPGSGSLINYGSDSPYVSSLSVCAALCVDVAECTGFFFVAGTKCHLQYGPVAFSPNGNPGSSPFYDEACFATC
ncbi:hypothetical protein V494_00398 [Pseudogymnoascus sp. VKM F-4513 (FW-928)]|nr:hypothetical protein V494_00398 [Pseudogymnoascus sp. VKM F-4513 (FW-928)]